MTPLPQWSWVPCHALDPEISGTCWLKNGNWSRLEAENIGFSMIQVTRMRLYTTKIYQNIWHIDIGHRKKPYRSEGMTAAAIPSIRNPVRLAALVILKGSFCEKPLGVKIEYPNIWWLINVHQLPFLDIPDDIPILMVKASNPQNSVLFWHQFWYLQVASRTLQPPWQSATLSASPCTSASSS